MQDHHRTALQSGRFFGKYLQPGSYKVTHRLNSVADLSGLVNQYDLFILDRDCTLHEYHGKQRVPEFEDALRMIAPKSELVSNSSYEELLRIRDVFRDLMPVSKLVKFTGFKEPFLLRFDKGKLQVLRMYENSFSDDTSIMSQGDSLLLDPSYNHKKPDPKILRAVIAANKFQERIPENSRVLMVGDRYLTDIVAGNLAGTDTAIVKPYRPMSDKPDLIVVRYALDLPLGEVMSRL